MNAPSRAMTARIKPRNVAPASPINTLAGGLLYFRYPSVTPTSTMDMSAESLWPLARATTNSVTAEIADNPPARPSMPSEKLMTVVTPKIHRIVRMNCSQNGSMTYSEVSGFTNPVNAMPEANTSTAAEI
ncbi:hypothetical protein D3C76_1453450 [compost metagenome]